MLLLIPISTHVEKFEMEAAIEAHHYEFAHPTASSLACTLLTSSSKQQTETNLLASVCRFHRCEAAIDSISLVSLNNNNTAPTDSISPR
jgi:hypothetical protein